MKISLTDRLMACRLMLEESYARASRAEYERDQALAEVARLNQRPLLVRLGLRKEDRPAQAASAPQGRPPRPKPPETGEGRT